jgi:ketosteroid isomerase-like protein
MTTVTVDEEAVHQTYLTWSNAFRSLDVAGLKDVFDSDFPGLVYQAEENVDPMYTWTEIDEYLSNAPRVVEAITEWREVTRKIAVDNNTAFVYAKLDTRLTVHGGLQPLVGEIRFSMAMRRTRAGWKIAQYHESRHVDLAFLWAPSAPASSGGTR